MMKRKIILTILTAVTFSALVSVPVKADTTTATNMLPILRAMYHVDEAEAIVNEKTAALAACRANNASAFEMATAQAAVNDATNLLNTLNTMIARDTVIIQAAPPGVVNPPSFATNSLAASGAWNDFMYKEKTGHVMVFPSSPVPSAYELTLAAKPFTMYTY